MDASQIITCTPKTLHPELWEEAARVACQINPANSPRLESAYALAGLFGSPPLKPEHIALMTTKYWGAKGVKLGVTFLDSAPADLRARIVGHMNAWGAKANVRFLEGSGGEVRIARRPGQGYWSFLGTDILMVPAGQQTMNLEAFTMQTPESEFRRVVRHETGHTLGFPHEHLRRELVDRIDPAKAVPFYKVTQGWSVAMVKDQVLKPLEDGSLLAYGRADVNSIMCYQIPASITKDGQPIPGGLDLDPADLAFAAQIYPPATGPALPAPPPKPPPPPWWWRWLHRRK